MDAYLEEELYYILTYCIQNPEASDFETKKQRVSMIGKELYADGELMLWRICFIQLKLE
jgi:hypothetical protein